MTVNDSPATTARAADDVRLAACPGGASFEKLALNPSLENISSHAERGSVVSTASSGHNPLDPLWAVPAVAAAVATFDQRRRVS